MKLAIKEGPSELPILLNLEQFPDGIRVMAQDPKTGVNWGLVAIRTDGTVQIFDHSNSHDRAELQAMGFRLNMAGGLLLRN